MVIRGRGMLGSLTVPEKLGRAVEDEVKGQLA
jgi:hypothetical protein